MSSLDFLTGAFFAISGIPFLILSVLLFKRLPLFLGITILAGTLGGKVDLARTGAVSLFMLALTIALGMVGSLLLAKGLLWIF